MDEKKNIYMSYPEGYNKLAQDLKMASDDPAFKSMMLMFFASTLVNN